MIVECNNRIMTMEEAETLNKPIFEVSDNYYADVLSQAYNLAMSGKNEPCELKAKNTGKRIR